MRFVKALQLVSFLLAITSVLSIVSAQEFISWSYPTNLKFDQTFPIVGALPDGRIAVVSYLQPPLRLNGILFLGIYDTNGILLHEVQVDDNIPGGGTSGYNPVAYAALDVSTNGKITVFYRRAGAGGYGLYFKQYQSDGRTISIDRTEVVGPNTWAGALDVTTTADGTIHVVFGGGGLINGRLYYWRFDSSGRSIGSIVSIPPIEQIPPNVDLPVVSEAVLAAYSPDSVIVGYNTVLMRHDENTRVFARKITNGILGPEWLVYPVYSCTPGRDYCRQRGLSVAVDGGNTYLTWWYSSSFDPHPQRNSRLLLAKLDADGAHVIAGRQISSFIPIEVDELLALSRIVVDRGRKWIFWIDRRAYAKTSNMFFEVLGPNDEILVDDQVLTHTRSEDFLQAVVDPMGNVHVVFTNGDFRGAGTTDINPRETEAPVPILFHTRSTTSTITVSGDTSPGGNAVINVVNPANAGKQYIFFASFSRGETLLGNGIVLPVKADAALFLSIINPGLFVFSNTQGTLDGSGSGSVLFNPRPDAPPGVVLHGGFAVYDTNGVKHISLPQRMIIKEGGG
ncbi:hypothetical protein HY469_00220 [Candidatus Roizmanbacteria bacterium]|nr:hypothetical protein [Candidatus Roizmanbacteria bacterium]